MKGKESKWVRMPEKDIWKILLLKGWRNVIMMYFQNRKEFSNYFLYLLISPNALIRSFCYYPIRIIQAVKRRLAPERYYYPKYIKGVAEECLNAKNQIRWLPPDKDNSDLNVDLPLSTESTIKLASVTLKGKEAEQPWNVKFEDKEDLMALHRWNWLITSNQNERLIEEWIERFIDKKRDNLIWDAYSTGERICNGLLFHWLTNKTPTPKVTTAFQEFAKYLIRHLEYHGQNTNNHIINNARSLYFAGCFLGVEQWQNLAQLIFKKELQKLITSDGFLREGSSHYHFLFTRWILEVLWLAQEKKDDKFVSFLKPFTSKLVKQRWFFLVRNQTEDKWSIPLIGDISPDFTPDWLLNTPPLKTALEEANLDNKNFEYKNSGWCRFDYNDLTLFIRVKLDEALGYPTHDHNDLGSFCLYIKGSPIIIDPGRLSYTVDNLSQYGLSARAHNSIIINGFEAAPIDKRNYFVKEYKLNKPKIQIDKLADSWNIRLEFYGFERLIGQKVQVKRFFKLQENKLEIQDLFVGKGHRNLETRFHFAPNIKIEQNNNNFKLRGVFGNAEFSVEQETKIRNIGDWYFPEYGRKQKSKTLVLSKDINLPCKIDYQLSWI